MHASAESPFPDQYQSLLLKAAIFSDQRAVESWKQWKSIVDFDSDVDHGSFRLLPLVYHNLSSSGYSDELVDGRLKGIYRQAWLKNQKLFYKAGKIIRLLHESGIETAVLKGIALTELVYKNPGIRPMADVDLIIPFSKARKGVETLEKSGFNMQLPHLLEYNLEFGRSMAFEDQEGTEIDLHWHALVYSHQKIKEKDFWDRTVPVKVGGVETQAFSLSDNLFHTLVHGIRKNPEPPIRWVADAMAILSSEINRVDWQRLLLFAKRLRVFLQVKRALIYLHDEFEADIPDDVLEELYSYKPTYVERVIFKQGEMHGDNIQKMTIGKRFFAFYARYLRQTSREGILSVHFGLLLYLGTRIKSRFNQFVLKS